MRATSQNGARIFYAILGASILLVSGLVCVNSGCTLHLHVGERHYCGESVATTQPAMIGSTNPEVILGAEP